MSPILLVPPSGPTTSHAFRLQPNAPLKESLCEVASIIFARLPPEKSSSLFIMTVVGSLRGVKLRLANACQKQMDSVIVDKGAGGVASSSMGGANDIREWKDERFEIISMEGTFSRDGSCHLHLGISDSNGNTFGGHLLEATVFTTAEVVLGSAEGICFSREYDDGTGYKELIPKQIAINDNNWRNEFFKITIAVFTGFVMGASFIQRRR
mmetsp:Transcript_21314/g.31994  ORF Transcript_21314/g.31994 Transcript_21314/m.31994 type:complete len:210 (+) Transcript_21314:118-747(+)